MKKFFIFIFAFIYLVTSSGFAFSMHYCMGKLSSVELFHQSKDKCGKCGMDTKNKCCNDKVSIVKVTDNQDLWTNGIKLFSLNAFSSNLYLQENTAFIPSSIQATNITDTSPPPDSGAFLCILHSVFRI